MAAADDFKRAGSDNTRISLLADSSKTSAREFADIRNKTGMNRRNLLHGLEFLIEQCRIGSAE